MRTTRTNLYRGFTLVELMVCLVIIGILSSIAVQKYGRHKTKILVKGEVFSALSPWIRDCRRGFQCWSCRGLSNHFTIKAGKYNNVCRVTATRAHSNLDVGDYVEIWIAEDGGIDYYGPLARYLR